MDNFHASSRISGWLHFDELVLSKAYKDLDEKLQKSYLMTLKGDANSEEKLTLDPKNDMRNLVNFSASSGKSENLYTKGWCEIFRKNDSWLEKWYQEFG